MNVALIGTSLVGATLIAGFCACKCKNKPKNKSINESKEQEISNLSKKIEIASTALNHAKQLPETQWSTLQQGNVSMLESNQKVVAYFNNAINQLEKGRDVSLPMYYRAVGDRDETIDMVLENGKFKTKDAPKGHGVFISTENEHDFGYVTFAMPKETFVNTKGFYFGGESITSNSALWVRVEENVNINPKTVAYLISNKNEVSKIKEYIEKRGLFVDVMDKDTAEGIHKCLKKATPKLEKPVNWRPPTQHEKSIMSIWKALPERMSHWPDVLPRRTFFNS